MLVERLDVRPDVEALFEARFLTSEYAFWLDREVEPAAPSRPTVNDARRGTGVTVLGDGSGPLARVARADVADGIVRVTSRNGTQVIESGFFDWLDRELAETKADVPALPFGFGLGWVGYLGYELKAECGGSRAHRSHDPDALLVFADRAIVVDHGAGTVYLLALTAADHDPDAAAWLTETAAVVTGPPAAPTAGAPLGAPPSEVRLRHGRADYLGMIARCQDAIARGESYEVCLTNMVTARVRVSPWHAFRELSRINPAPFAALLRFGDLGVVSASPERFLAVSADGEVESQPIKGTRPRGETAEADECLRRDLATSEKDRAENLMIVDLVRNDLAVCAEVGSVRVPRLFEVRTYPTVHHLVSTVRARLRPGASAVACARAAFPGGSMTGAPKARTMEILDELERGPRGVYSGAIGFFSLTGAADLSMTIRTLVVGPEEVSFGVGGAIIAPSDPAAEFEETAVKARPMLRLLGATFPAR